MRAWSLIRASTPRRTFPRPGVLAVERLESRFLLAGGGIDQAGASPARPAPAAFAGLPIAPTANPQGPVIANGSPIASPSPGAGGRIDSFELEAAMGVPEVQVELRWSNGPTPADGQLVLVDASGETVLQASLVGVIELRATIYLPVGQAGLTTAPLALDLTITRPINGATDPGSYRLSLAWQPSPTPLIPGQFTGPSLDPAQLPAIPAPPASLPELTVTGLLPFPGGSASGSDPNLPGSPRPLPLVLDEPTPPPAGSDSNLPSTGPGNPVLPLAVVAPPPASTAAPSSIAGNHPSSVAAGTNPAPATASGSSSQDPQTFVGPLPFGVSIPDGGIFEQSSAQTNSVRVGGAVDRRGTAGLLVPVARSTPTATDGVTWTAPGFVGRRKVPFGRSPAAPDRRWATPLRPGDGEFASDPSSVGVAFLPPIAHFSDVDRRGNAARRVEIQTARPRSPRGDSVVAVLVAVTSSAAMVLTLSGPDRFNASRSERADRFLKGREG